MRHRLDYLGLLTLVFAVAVGCGEDAPEEEDLPENQRNSPPRQVENPRIDRTNTGGFGTGPLGRAQGDIAGEPAGDFYGALEFSPQQPAVEGPPSEEHVLSAECSLGQVHLYLQKNGTYRLFCDNHPEMNQTGEWRADGAQITLDDLGTAKGYFKGGERWIRLDLRRVEAWPNGERPHALDFHRTPEPRRLQQRVREDETRRAEEARRLREEPPSPE